MTLNSQSYHWQPHQKLLASVVLPSYHSPAGRHMPIQNHYRYHHLHRRRSGRYRRQWIMTLNSQSYHWQPHQKLLASVVLPSYHSPAGRHMPIQNHYRYHHLHRRRSGQCYHHWIGIRRYRSNHWQLHQKPLASVALIGHWHYSSNHHARRTTRSTSGGTLIAYSYVVDPTFG